MFYQSGIVAYVEKTLRSEIVNSKNKPIYLVGESLGSCIAFTVAARNPDVDLMIVSANSGSKTAFFILIVMYSQVN